jgi:oligopeptide/dipeptide ABC transporter ATP-binding protein
VVERAPAKELFASVRMPYTQALLDAIPQIDREPHVLLPVVGGRPPDLSALVPGCPFAPRCPGVQQDCREQAPTLAEHEPRRWWACWHPLNRAAQ